MSEKSNDVWQRLIKRHQVSRKRMIELNLKIEKGMEDYLKNISKNDDFTIRFEDSGLVNLDCEGDLFDLEQIGDFCDTFSLKLIINNRTIVENHIEDNTRIRTRYLFTTHAIQQEED